MDKAQQMFWINERLRFISARIDQKRLDQLRVNNILDREAIGKDISKLVDKRRSIINEGEILLYAKD